MVDFAGSCLEGQLPRGLTPDLLTITRLTKGR